MDSYKNLYWKLLLKNIWKLQLMQNEADWAITCAHYTLFPKAALAAHLLPGPIQDAQTYEACLRDYLSPGTSEYDTPSY